MTPEKPAYDPREVQDKPKANRNDHEEDLNQGRSSL